MYKILIVENTALTALRLQMELENAGYTITDICSTSNEAIQSILLDPPDIVLLDFHLDKNTQGDTVALFLNSNYNIPIIYLSKYANNKTIDFIEKTHFHAYLTKPFLPNALILTVRQALKSRESKVKPNLEKLSFVSDHIEHTILANEVLWINTKPGTKGIFITTRQAEEQYRVYETIKDFLSNRQLAKFIQISSSYILNFDYVTDIEGNNKITIGSNNLPKIRQLSLDDSNTNRSFKIGKTFKQAMKAWLMQWGMK